MPDLTDDVERELAALDDALAGRRVASDLAELGELALALRDERPQINDGFARHLDMRVERGFPGRDPRRRVSRRRLWAGWMAPALGATATVLLIAVIVVAGPSGSDDENAGGGASAGTAASGQASSDSAGGAAESAGGGGGARAGGAESAEGTTSALSAPPAVPPEPGPGSPRTDKRSTRSIERSAALTLATRSRDIDAVSKRIQQVTSAQGGFVLSSTVNSSADGGGGTFRLRVPTRNLDAAMTALSRLGNVRERSDRSQDITAQAVSARSRLKDAKTERKSLLRQLADAVTLTQTEAIRARLRIVAREIEQARAGVRRVNNRAAFATIALELIADNSVASGSSEDDWTPGDAAKDALRVLEVAAGVALIVLAVALPLALLGAAAGLVGRWGRKRRREHALDAV